jgi:hypothetical protein
LFLKRDTLSLELCYVSQGVGSSELKKVVQMLELSKETYGLGPGNMVMTYPPVFHISCICVVHVDMTCAYVRPPPHVPVLVIWQLMMLPLTWHDRSFLSPVQSRPKLDL